MPALELHANDLWEVHSSTPMVTSRKLSRARYLELLRGAMLQAGLEPKHAASVHFNRLRRFTPTVGNLLKMSATDMQSIGSWQEVPDGGGREGAKPKAVMHMGLHYSGQKLQRSAQVKIHIVQVLQEAFAKKSSELALVDGLLTRGSWTWQDLAGQLEHQPPKAVGQLPPEEHQLANPEVPVELPVVETPVDDALVVDYDPDDEKEAESSSSDPSGQLRMLLILMTYLATCPVTQPCRRSSGSSKGKRFTSSVTRWNLAGISLGAESPLSPRKCPGRARVLVLWRPIRFVPAVCPGCREVSIRPSLTLQDGSANLDPLV